jgi:hypothetical protein
MSPAGRFPLHSYCPKIFICTFLFCNKSCRTKGGLKRHARLHHQHDSHYQVPTLEQHCSEISDQNDELGLPGTELPNQSGRHIRFHPILDGTCPHSMVLRPTHIVIVQGCLVIPMGGISHRLHTRHPLTCAPKTTGHLLLVELNLSSLSFCTRRFRCLPERLTY